MQSFQRCPLRLFLSCCAAVICVGRSVLRYRSPHPGLHPLLKRSSFFFRHALPLLRYLLRFLRGDIGVARPFLGRTGYAFLHLLAKVRLLLLGEFTTLLKLLGPGFFACGSFFGSRLCRAFWKRLGRSCYWGLAARPSMANNKADSIRRDEHSDDDNDRDDYASGLHQKLPFT
jgi:hypothetical protein